VKASALELQSHPACAIGGNAVDTEIDPLLSSLRIVHGPNVKLQAGCFDFRKLSRVDHAELADIEKE
jgi:hypothetical protein